VAGRAIGVAKLRLDGFVSMNAGSARGEFTTVPVILKNSGLWVNGDVRGAAQVEILDANNRPISALAGANAGAFAGDGTRLPVRFARTVALGEIAGRPVRLRFGLQDAALYSYWSDDAV